MRKSLLILVAVLSLLPGIFAQEESAIQFEGAARLDFIGLKNHNANKHKLFHGEVDLGASASTEDLGLFKGGEIFVQAMGVFGHNASGDYAGDLQVFSNIENDSRIFLYEAWYKHTFNRFSVKVGQLDMNAEYLISSWASPMLNSSFGVIPTISLNMPVSIFGYLSAGVSVKYRVTNRITVQSAYYDGNPGDYETNRYNLNWQFSKNDGWFNISEIHYKTKSNLMQGMYKAGFFYHSNGFPGDESLSADNRKMGFYVMGDQQLIAEKNTIENGLNMFFQLSWCPESNNLVKSYYALGLIYRGLIPRMNEDELTVAYASARIDDNMLALNPMMYGDESFIEIAYKKYFTPNIIVQPDFQYIIRPGATKEYNGNVSVFLLRTTIEF